MQIVDANPEQGTPVWWLNKLHKKLDDRNQKIAVYANYYDGNHNLKFSTQKYKSAFGNAFQEFADNWCQLICDAPVERLSVEGFRYGQDTKGDSQAWKIWQQNDMDALQELAWTEAYINCESYGLVWPDEDDPSFPRITIEHPTECIVEFAAGSKRKRAAGLKRWLNDDGFVYATLYLPDAIYKFQSSQKHTEFASLDSIKWATREVKTEVWPLRNPFGVVPLVPLPNKPRLIGGGVSEIKDVIPVQDAVNKTLTDLLITSEFAAAPRRYATGFVPPKDKDGNPLKLETMVDRMLTTSQKDAKFGQFPPADLSGFVSTVQMLVQHLASRSRTPPHYFYLSGQFPSGESIKSAETGLVAKVRRQQHHFGEGCEEIMRLAFFVKGNKSKANDHTCETVWADAESRSESEHIDAIGKKRAILHIPLEQAWQDAGYTPQQIERMKVQLKEEQEWLGPLGVSEAATKGTQILAGMANQPGTPAAGSIEPA